MVSTMDITSQAFGDAYCELPRDPVHGGIASTCESCPSNDGITESATHAQNLGCGLPTAFEIVKMAATEGKTWACHSNSDKPCAGLCRVAKPLGLDLSKNVLFLEPGVHSTSESTPH